jgi:hypothetical protein
MISLQMQAIYTQVLAFPDTSDVDRLLARLRVAAWQARSLDVDTAQPVGDFWLLTADLVDIHRSPLAPDAQRAQARRLLQRFLDQHPDARQSDAVKAALAHLPDQPQPPMPVNP